MGSIVEKSPQRPIIGFLFDASSRNLLGLHDTILYKEYNISPKPVDILSFDSFFIECDIAKGMIFKGRKSGFTQNWTMTVDPGYRYTKKFAGGITWYMTQSKDVISSISFRLKNENNELVSFNGQSIS